MNTKEIGPFLGINNRLQDFSLHVRDKGDFLASAVNVDIDNALRVRRRESTDIVQALSSPHSMFENYVVIASSIYSVVISPYSQTFVKSLTSNARMSWVREGNDIFYSNGTDSGRITAGVFYPLGLPTPSAPGVSGTGGGMLAGTYQVAVSYFNNVTGEEGGVSPSSNPTSAGGLVVTLPSAVPGATHVNVYVSMVNGSIPQLSGQYVVGTASATFSANPAAAREAPQRFEAPLPAGRLFMSNGRLCSFSGNTVYVGLPYRYGYHDIVGGWVAFNDPVTIGIANQQGTYIATEANTYWLTGDLGDVKDTLTEPFPFGGVLGTEWRHPATTDVGWFSENGFIVANTMGQAKPVTYDVLDIETVPSEGCSDVRWSRGFVRAYSCGYCLNLENNAVTQYSDYDFTSFSGNYGTKVDGIYSIGGVSLVEASVGLGKQDFGTLTFKHMPAVYVGCSSAAPIGLEITWPGDNSANYTARSSSPDLRAQRIDVGKGIRANWFDLRVYNTEGDDFTFASISFAPVASARRI